LAREGLLVLPAAGEQSFAQLVVGDPRDASIVCSATISIETDGVLIRVPGDISVSRLGDIVRVLRLA
jgi:hypothetical protein